MRSSSAAVVQTWMKSTTFWSVSMKSTALQPEPTASKYVSVVWRTPVSTASSTSGGPELPPTWNATATSMRAPRRAGRESLADARLAEGAALGVGAGVGGARAGHAADAFVGRSPHPAAPRSHAPTSATAQLRVLVISTPWLRR